MSDTAQVLRLDTHLPDDPAAHARVLQPLLAQAAGPGAQPVSLTLDYGVAAGAGEPVTAEAWVERRGGSTNFMEARLLDPAGEVLAKASSTIRMIPRAKVEAASKAATT